MPLYLSSPLIQALQDYQFLLNKGYPFLSTLKLVGDRYRLSRQERMILFRGVLRDETNEYIRRRLLSDLPPQATLAIDGFNVLFTLINYKRGHPLFISTDGLLRDAGGAHGRIENPEDWKWGLHLLCTTLDQLLCGHLWIYLDAPVSHSGDYRKELEEKLGDHSIPAEVILSPCADLPIQSFDGTAIASSDSNIALRCRTSIFDLARYILERHSQVPLVDLRAFTHPHPVS